MGSSDSNKKLIVIRTVIVCVAIVIAGGFVMNFLAMFKKAPAEKTGVEVSLKVDVVAARKSLRAVSVTEYGTAEAVREVVLSAQVSGRIISLNPKVKRGNILEVGEEILSIDPVAYESALAAAQAEVVRLEVELKKNSIAQQADVMRVASLEKDLALAETLLERKQSLFAKNAVSQTDVDSAEQTVAQKRSSYLALKTSVDLFEYTQKTLEAQLTAARAGVKRAAVDLEHCVIQSPFKARVVDEQIELNQFVSIGSVVGTFADDSSLEIPVSISGVEAVKLGITSDDSQADMFRLGGGERVDAQLNWVDAADAQSIAAKVVRIENYDPDTRTIRFIVSPVKKRENTPLVAGMFCRVTLTGKVSKPLVAIPRTSLQFGGRIFVVDDDSRIREKMLTFYHRDETYLYVEKGLAGGERVVISKLPFDLVTGMKVVATVQEQ